MRQFPVPNPFFGPTLFVKRYNQTFFGRFKRWETLPTFISGYQWRKGGLSRLVCRYLVHHGQHKSVICREEPNVT
jgi:hypothetical protein